MFEEDWDEEHGFSLKKNTTTNGSSLKNLTTGELPSNQATRTLSMAGLIRPDFVDGINAGLLISWIFSKSSRRIMPIKSPSSSVTGIKLKVQASKTSLASANVFLGERQTISLEINSAAQSESSPDETYFFRNSSRTITPTKRKPSTTGKNWLGKTSKISRMVWMSVEDSTMAQLVVKMEETVLWLVIGNCVEVMLGILKVKEWHVDLGDSGGNYFIPYLKNVWFFSSSKKVPQVKNFRKPARIRGNSVHWVLVFHATFVQALSRKVSLGKSLF